MNNYKTFNDMGIEKSREELYEDNTMLTQENAKLKKQLEERPKEYFFIGNAQNKTRDFINNITKENTKLLNQQKEFVNWLKSMSKMYEEEYKDIDVVEHYNCVLAKYNEIIGGEND